MLSRIDELVRPAYPYLDPADTCYFLREYTAGRGFRWSETNSLVSNFKKSPRLRGLPEWQYKERALEQLARELRNSLDPVWLGQATLVPLPPSRAPDDAEYDDRMVRLLKRLAPDRRLDIRELLHQNRSTDPAHLSIRRPRPEEIAGNYQVDRSLLDPVPSRIGLFDDVLTTGAHFKAASMVLRLRFPRVPIIGVFLARVVRLDDSEG